MLSLDGLIASKRAMERTQGRLILPELEMMHEAAQHQQICSGSA